MATGGSLIGALRVTLGLDSAQFEAGAKRARGVAKREATEIQKIVGGAKLALAGLVSTATVTAFAAATKRAFDYAGGLGEIAQQAGITTKALQEQAAIGIDVGLSLDDIASANARLSKTLGAAQDGNKKAAETFRQLKIDVDGLTAEEAMPKLIAAFERIKSPTDQARIASELFGRSAGAKLLPMLNMTADGFEAARQQAHEFGLVLSDDAIASADAASDSIARLSKVVEINFAAAMAGGADGVASLADELAKMVARLPGQIDSIRNFAFVAAEALRSAGPLGEFVANKAKRAYATSLSNKDFAAAQRLAAANLKANPNDPEALAYAQFLLQQGKSREARAAGNGKPAPSIGDIVPRTDRSGTPKKGPKDRSADYLERYNREFSALQDEQLSLQQDITTDVRERARLEHLRIDNEQAAYNFDVENRLKSGDLTQAQADALKLQYEQNAQKQKTLVNWRLDDELTEQELDLKKASVDLENAALSRELDGARTQEDRRRIQLRILQNEMDLERAALEAVKAKHKSTDVEYQIAQQKLDQLGQEQAGRAAAIRRDTMGPLEQWRSEGTQTAAEMREAFENITVDALNSSLDLATRNMFKLKGAAGELMNQILSDVIRLQLRSMMSGRGGLLGGIVSAIGGLFGGGKIGSAVPAGWGDTSVLGGSIDWNAMTAGISLPRLATGGSFMAGGNSGVDRNVLAINGIPKVRVSANERVTVSPAGQGGAPIVIQMYSEEGPALVPRVSAISDGVTMQNMTRSAAYSARAGRQSLARG